MSRRMRRGGPLARSAVSTCLGLAAGYLVFLAVILCAIFQAAFTDARMSDEVTFLFLCWMILLVPIGLGAIFLAWLVVLPVERVLCSYRASPSVYLATGGALAAAVGFGILQFLLGECGVMLGPANWPWLIAPMMASITTGLVIGDQLWKRRPVEDEASVTPSPNRP